MKFRFRKKTKKNIRNMKNKIINIKKKNAIYKYIYEKKK